MNAFITYLTTSYRFTGLRLVLTGYSNTSHRNFFKFVIIDFAFLKPYFKALGTSLFTSVTSYQRGVKILTSENHNVIKVKWHIMYYSMILEEVISLLLYFFQFALSPYKLPYKPIYTGNCIPICIHTSYMYMHIYHRHQPSKFMANKQGWLLFIML